jgi:hypothetical protein
MDSYADANEDPLSLHKYLCQDDPVDHADPTGYDGLDGMPDVASSIGASIIGELPITGGASAALPQKSLALNTVIMYFAKCDDAQVEDFVKVANDILAQAAIKVQLSGPPKHWTYEETEKRTDGDFTADRFVVGANHVVQMGSNWKDITRGQSGSAPNAYFCQKFLNAEGSDNGGILMGMAATERFGTPPYPAVFLKDVSLRSTLAHELCHVLGLPHVEDEGIIDEPDNLMTAHGFGTQLTPSQVNIIRGSKLLH